MFLLMALLIINNVKVLHTQEKGMASFFSL